MRASALIDQATEVLLASPAIEHWQKGRERIEAEELLAHLVGVAEVEPDLAVPPPIRRRFDAFIARRATGEPVAYITGHTEFAGLSLAIRPGVFIPRAYTEFMAEQAVRRLRGRPAPTHLDLATGSGAVALAVGDALPLASVFGVDVAADAVSLARRNAGALGLANVRFVTGDLFDGLSRALRGRIDVITFHPPFIPREDVAFLPDEVGRFEPVHTLTDGSDDGLELVRRSAGESHRWLRPGGWLLIEVSPDRSRAVSTVMRRAGFGEVRSTKGEWEVARVVVGRWPG